MADKRYSAEYVITGNAADALRDIQGQAKKTEGAISDGADATKKAATETTSFTDRLNKLKVAYDLVAKQAAEAVKEFAKQEASTGRLSNAFNKAGLSAEQLNKAQAGLIANRDKLGVGIVEQQEALRQLVEATGDAEMAQRDLNLALDIASQENMTLEQATESLRKARNGETEELKNLNGITKEQSQALGQMQGDAARGSAAIRQLRDAYDGAAEANAGTEEKLNAYREQLKEAQAALGQMIVSMGGLAGSFADVASSAVGAEVSVRAFAGGMSELADQTEQVNSEWDKFWEEFSGDDVIEGFKRNESGLETYNRVLDRAHTNLARAADEQERFNDLMSGSPLLDIGAGASERSTPGPGGAANIMDAVSEDELAAQRKKDEEKAERQKKAAAERAKEREREREASAEAAAAAVDAAMAAGEQAVEEERKKDILEEQLRVRDEIARAKLEERDLDALILELENSKLTPLERQLRLTREIEQANARASQEAERQADQAEQAAKSKKQETKAVVDASGQAASGIIGALSDSDEAKMASAALDAAMYGYKAIVAFIESNPAAGIGYTTAAVQAAAVAAGSAGGGGAAAKGGKGAGGASTAARPDPEAQARRQARLFAEEFSREQQSQGIVYNINYRSIARPTEREARLIGEATQRNQQTTVGGARNLNIGGG